MIQDTIEKIISWEKMSKRKSSIGSSWFVILAWCISLGLIHSVPVLYFIANYRKVPSTVFGDAIPFTLIILNWLVIILLTVVCLVFFENRFVFIRSLAVQMVIIPPILLILLGNSIHFPHAMIDHVQFGGDGFRLEDKLEGSYRLYWCDDNTIWCYMTGEYTSDEPLSIELSSDTTEVNIMRGTEVLDSISLVEGWRCHYENKYCD